MEELISLVTNVGFPIAVAVYLLIRVEGKLSQLTKAIYELREAIITLPRDNTLPLSKLENYRQVQSYAD